MFNQKLLLLFALITLFGSIDLDAQRSRPPMRFLEVKAVDQDKMQCTYRYDVVEDGGVNKSYLNLQIGTHMSKCCGYRSFQMDSLGFVLGNKLYDPNDLGHKWSNVKQVYENVDWTIYSDYPTGQVTITDRVFTDNYESVEPRTTLVWDTNYTDSKEIMGYPCKKATIEAWGRTWQAWYAPGIPVAAGPWELRGLPGLILEASDASGDHTFQAVRIRQTNEPIVYRIANRFKEKRDRVVREKIRFKGNVQAYTEGNVLLQSEGGKQPPRVKSIPYTPLRLPTSK